MGYICSSISVLVALLCSLHHVTSLQCYACADSGDNNDCQSFETYSEGFEGKRPKVLKNCTEHYDSVCFIETYQSNGKEISHIRDCGNGEDFSFNVMAGSPQAPNYTRLEELGVNNETACVFTGQYIICLTKCNDTDFCNGPRVTDVNQGHAVTPSSLLKTSIGLSLVLAWMTG